MSIGKNGPKVLIEPFRKKVATILQHMISHKGLFLKGRLRCMELIPPSAVQLWAEYTD